MLVGTTPIRWDCIQISTNNEPEHQVQKCTYEIFDSIIKYPGVIITIIVIGTVDYLWMCENERKANKNCDKLHVICQTRCIYTRTHANKMCCGRWTDGQRTIMWIANVWCMWSDASSATFDAKNRTLSGWILNGSSIFKKKNEFIANLLHARIIMQVLFILNFNHFQTKFKRIRWRERVREWKKTRTNSIAYLQTFNIYSLELTGQINTTHSNYACLIWVFSHSFSVKNHQLWI